MFRAVTTKSQDVIAEIVADQCQANFVGPEITDTNIPIPANLLTRVSVQLAPNNNPGFWLADFLQNQPGATSTETASCTVASGADGNWTSLVVAIKPSAVKKRVRPEDSKGASVAVL
jgi:hypothetical protein